MLPSFWRAGRDAGGLDRFTGASLRVLGSGAAAMAILGAVYGGWGAVLMVRLATQGDQSGWDGLIAALAVTLGGGMLAVGALLVVAGHVAFKGWRDERPRPVLVVAVVLLAVGATFWMPYAWQEYRAPLDMYLMLGRLALLAWGALLLAWTR